MAGVARGEHIPPLPIQRGELRRRSRLVARELPIKCRERPIEHTSRQGVGALNTCASIRQRMPVTICGSQHTIEPRTLSDRACVLDTPLLGRLCR